MTPERDPIEQQLAAIAARLDAIEGRMQQRGIWDRLSKIATTLIPAVIALAGYYITQEISRAEIRVAEQNTRISQSELVSTYMPHLNSDDPNERIIAVQGMLISLDSLGERIAETVLSYDPDTTVQEATRQLLEQKERRALSAEPVEGAALDELVSRMYAPDAATRRAATAIVVRDHLGDRRLVPLLARRAAAQPDNRNGLYNSIYVLSRLPEGELRIDPASARRIVEAASAVGGGHRQAAERVLERLGED